MKTFAEQRAEEAKGGSYKLRRRMDPEMPTINELVVALWEKFVEGRPEADEAIQKIQARRQRVKARYGKR